jgi:hypothetical protein
VTFFKINTNILKKGNMRTEGIQPGSDLGAPRANHATPAIGKMGGVDVQAGSLPKTGWTKVAHLKVSKARALESRNNGMC